MISFQNLLFTLKEPGIIFFFFIKFLYDFGNWMGCFVLILISFLFGEFFSFFFLFGDRWICYLEREKGDAFG